MLLPGRIMFAVAIMGFGIVSLLFVEFVAQLQPVNQLVPTTTPGYRPLAVMTGAVLVGCGLALLANVRTYHAAILLAVFFALWIPLLQVPTAFINPALLRSPWWVRTFEIVVLAGAALILAGLARQPVHVRWVHVGRMLFGISLPVFGVLHFIYAENTARIVPAFYPWPLFLVYFTGAAKLLAGLAIATGVAARLAATLVAVQYGIYALTLHIPNQFRDRPPDYQPGGITSMFIAIGFCGAAMIVAGSLDKKRSGER